MMGPDGVPLGIPSQNTKTDSRAHKVQLLNNITVIYSNHRRLIVSPFFSRPSDKRMNSHIRESGGYMQHR
jgi:hypothetical protein